MQTYTHALLTAALGHGLRAHAVPVRSRAFLLGSFMPDAPLFLLTLGFAGYYRFIEALPAGYRFFEWYDVLYFTNPVWIASHNALHAPLMVLLLGGVGYWAAQRGHGWGWSLVWFALGCGLHSLVDIGTHYDDGPVIFFPFNWSWRFHSPISYWDDDHYARLVAPLEHVLDAALIGYLWLGRRRKT
jgi:hypothetical protein